MTTPVPEIAHLRLLIAVAELGSLGAAARHMVMAQPNASRALSRLERQLGLTLVERSTTGSSLTEEGHRVVGWARQVVSMGECLVAGAESLREENQQHLRIAASMTVAHYLAPRWLGELRKARPEVTVELDVMNSDSVVQQVQKGDCYVGFIEAPHVPSGLRMLNVGSDTLCIVVGPTHEWARRRNPVSRALLASTPLILRESGSGTRQALERELVGLGLAPPILEFSSNDAVRIAAESGVAPAVLSDLVVGPTISAGRLVRIPFEDDSPSRAFHAIWRSHLPRPATDLLRVARAPGARHAIAP